MPGQWHFLRNRCHFLAVFQVRSVGLDGFGVGSAAPLAGGPHRLPRVRASRPEPGADPEDAVGQAVDGLGDGGGLCEDELLESHGHHGDGVLKVRHLRLRGVPAHVREQFVAGAGEDSGHGDQVEVGVELLPDAVLVARGTRPPR